MQTELTTSFIDDLLSEVESKEEQLTAAHYDLIIIEIAKLESEMNDNFNIAEKEIDYIKDWVINQNFYKQERIDLLKLKLESFIRSENRKTIDLPHGTLKIRKSPDKVEIADMDLFLAGANADLVNVIPETVKPDLNKIKSYIKMTTKIPEGISLIDGVEKFSLVLRGSKEEN